MTLLLFNGNQLIFIPNTITNPNTIAQNKFFSSINTQNLDALTSLKCYGIDYFVAVFKELYLLDNRPLYDITPLVHEWIKFDKKYTM